MALEAANTQPEAAPQETPKPPSPETAQTPPAEHWTKKPFEGGSLGAAEKAAELRGLGKELDQKAEAESEKFGEETKSLWGRVKERMFKKKDVPPVKGEAEILAEVEKADAVYAEFKRVYEGVLASGDERSLRSIERSLSQAYEQLAPQVATEGAGESKQWKEALKTGEMPQMTEAGAKLNDVTRRLMEVRGKLGAAPPKAEAPAAAREAAEEIFNEAERAQLLADAAELKAPVAEAVPPPAPAEMNTPPQAENIPSAPEAPAKPSAESTEDVLARQSPSDRAEAERLLYGGKVQVGKGFFSKQDKGREGIFANEEKGRKGFFSKEGTGKVNKGFFGKNERVGGLAGTPAEVMLGAYLRAKDSVSKTDEYGEVIGASIDAKSAEVVTKYADGSKTVETPDGRKIRYLANGKLEQPKQAAAAPKPIAEALPAAVEAAPKPAEEAPEAPEKTTHTRADLEKAAAGLPGAKMIDAYLAYEGVKADAYGTISDVTFDPRKGEIRVLYEDKSELRNYSTGKSLRVFPGGKAEEVAGGVEEGAPENPILLTPEMKKPSVEGVVSGEVEVRPEAPEPVQEERVIVAPEATKLDIVSSEQDPTASGEIVSETELPVEDGQIIEEKSAAAEATTEKKEFPMDKLEAGSAEVAEKLLPLAKASETPKTYGSKVVGKMPAAEFLKLFSDAGRISAEEAAALAEEFKTDPESFNAARKKVVAAINKLTR